MMSEHILHTEKIGNYIYRFYSRYDESSDETKCFIDREMLDDVKPFETTEGATQRETEVQKSGDGQMVASFAGNDNQSMNGRLERFRGYIVD